MTRNGANVKSTVVLLNSYSMRRAFDLWCQGRSQSHHVWGFAALASDPDLDVHFDDAEASASPLQRAMHRLCVPRTVQLQLGYLWKYRSADVVYAATYSVARLLGLARAFGLFKPKVVALAHFPLRPGVLDRLALRGVDRLLFLCHATQQSVVSQFAHLPAGSAYIGWAVDTAFYAQARIHRQRAQQSMRPDDPFCIVAAGKDNRDYQTFVKGLAMVNGPLRVKVFCSRESAPVVQDPRVVVRGADSVSNPLSIEELLVHYADSDVIAIPLHAIGRVAGLTSLLDALALGMPVLCTRNPGLDIDIEAIGCGFWVDTNDPHAWAQAVARLPQQRSELQAMGALGLAFAERELDMGRYTDKVAVILRSVLRLPQRETA